MALCLAILSAGSSAQTWSTSANSLQLDGKDVVLHGIGTTCTEYLLRGIGMECWAVYNWADPASIIVDANVTAVGQVIDRLHAAKSDGTAPMVRIPMTAAYWLDVETAASKANRAKYPGLSRQYRKLISNLVGNYTAAGVVVVLDLHWNSDDTEQQPMALKGSASYAAGGAEFWASVSASFAENVMVFYEIYNEPHTTTDIWLNGNGQYVGVLDLIAAVRKGSPKGMIVVAGSAAYAYDSASLVTLDGKLKATGEKNVVYNFHPYMGPDQAGDHTKCPVGFETHVENVFSGTSKPVMVTEFGQACCPTNGACESCAASFDGKPMGYDEAIVTVATKHPLSWMPWAWRPSAKGPGANCQDINGIFQTNGPVDGKGANWTRLWDVYAGSGPPSPPSPPSPPGPSPPSPPSPPSGCPGGSLSACIALCPSTPPSAYKDCVGVCAQRCSLTA